MQRVAIVMAATEGLGRACADALAKAGHDLVICSRRQEQVTAAAKELSTHGGRVAGIVADVSKAEDLERLFAAADETFGRLDVLVTNSGGPTPGTLLSLTDAQWQTGYELTLLSTVRAMRAAVPRMKPNGYGRIVAITSSSIRAPLDNLVLSNAFRPAIVGLVKSLAPEVAASGITVNAVAPGRADTGRVRTLDEGRAKASGVTYEQLRASAEKTIPMGRYGRPEEVAALVRFLASEEASYITGQAIMADGGMVRSLP